jgi:hypothetical protein
MRDPTACRDCLFSQHCLLLWHCNTLKELPDGVTTLGPAAFYACPNLREIVLPVRCSIFQQMFALEDDASDQTVARLEASIQVREL